MSVKILKVALLVVLVPGCEAPSGSPRSYGTPMPSPPVPPTYETSVLSDEYDGILDLAMSPTGMLYVLDQSAVYRVSESGSRTSVGYAIREQGPNHLAVDAAGTVFLTYREVGGIRSQGDHSQGGLPAPDHVEGIALGADGTAFAVDPSGPRILLTSTRGRSIVFAGPSEGDSARGYVDATGTKARFSNLTDLGRSADGRLFVLDVGNGVIRRISLEGAVDTWPAATANGDEAPDGPPGRAKFANPTRLSVTPSGEPFVVDQDRVRHVSTSGWVTTIATAGQPCTGPQPTYGEGCDSQGKPTFLLPGAIAANDQGDVYLADAAGKRVWRLRKKS